MEYLAYSFPEFPFDMLIIYHKSVVRRQPGLRIQAFIARVPKAPGSWLLSLPCEVIKWESDVYMI